MVLGTSQGASAAIVAATKCSDIDAFVLGNPFCSPQTLIRANIANEMVQIPLPFLTQIMVEPVIKLSLFFTDNLSPSAQVRVIDYTSRMKCPCLLIHETADTLVHFRES